MVEQVQKEQQQLAVLLIQLVMVDLAVVMTGVSMVLMVLVILHQQHHHKEILEDNLLTPTHQVDKVVEEALVLPVVMRQLQRVVSVV